MLLANAEKLVKPWQMGTLLRVLIESYPMNTNVAGIRWFSKTFVSLCFGWKHPASIGRVKLWSKVKANGSPSEKSFPFSYPFINVIFPTQFSYWTMCKSLFVLQDRAFIPFLYILIDIIFLLSFPIEQCVNLYLCCRIELLFPSCIF